MSIEYIFHDQDNNRRLLVKADCVPKIGEKVVAVIGEDRIDYAVTSVTHNFRIASDDEEKNLVFISKPHVYGTKK